MTSTLDASERDRAASSWGKDHFEREAAWGSHCETERERARVLWTVSLLPEEVNTVLDLGSGSGSVAREVQTQGRDVVAADLSLTALRHVRERGVQADAIRLPFRSRSFDAVLAAEMIEHLAVSTRARALAEMARVAKQWIVVTVPFSEVLELSQVKCGDCGCVFHPWRHTASFDERLMRKLFREEFRVVETSLMGKPRPVAFRPLISIAQGLGGYAKVYKGLVICPGCRNGDHFIYRRTLLTRVLRSLPSRLMRPRRASWIGAVYERSQAYR